MNDILSVYEIGEGGGGGEKEEGRGGNKGCYSHTGDSHTPDTYCVAADMKKVTDNTW